MEVPSPYSFSITKKSHQNPTPIQNKDKVEIRLLEFTFSEENN